MSDLIDKAEALLPCPFCGGAPKLKLGRGAWGVLCTCGGKAFVHTYEGGFVSTGKTTEEAKASAIAAWNRRALPARGVGVKPLRYVEPHGDTLDQMRENARQQPLAREGDMLLVWVNEGDLYEHAFPIAAFAPTDAAQARSRCPYGATGDDCCGGYCDMDDDRKGGDAHDRRLRSHEASPGVTAGADAAQAREAVLIEAALEWREAQSALNTFEAENPGNTTKRWVNLMRDKERAEEVFWNAIALIGEAKPAPSQAREAALAMLNLHDDFLAGKPVDLVAANCLHLAASFGAQAFAVCPEPDARPSAMLRAFLLAMIDPMHPDLDYLRAKNVARLISEART